MERPRLEADLGARGTPANEHHHTPRGGRRGGGAPRFGAPDGLEHELMAGGQMLLRRDRAQLLGLGAPFGVRVGDRHVSALRDQERGQHQSHRAAADHADVGRVGAARAADCVDCGGERLGHGRGVGGQFIGDEVQCRRGRRDPLGEAAEDPRERAADLGAPGCALSACAAGHRVGHKHALAGVGAYAGRLVAEATRVWRQHPMSVAPHLGVGPARSRGLDLDDHLALGLENVLDPEVLRAEQNRGPHGSTTIFRPVASR